MNNQFRFIGFVAVILALTACGNGLVPLTRQSINTYGLTVHELKYLQFYTSSEARFFKNPQKTEEKSIRYGDLHTEKGMKTEVVVLEEKTPGIVSDNASDLLILPIDFDDITLPFVSSLSGRYVLRLRDKSGKSLPIHHKGETYLPFSSNEEVTLLVRHKDLEEIYSSGEVIGGQKLGWWAWFWGP